MRRFLIAMLLLSSPLVAKERAVGRRPDFDPARPSAPAAGIQVGQASDLPTMSLLWRVTLSTGSARPFSDPSWLAANKRTKDGSFQVIVWRFRFVEPIPHACATQTLTIPAQPDQTVVDVLDMTSFQSGDVIMFEEWPGYDVRLDVYDSAQNLVTFLALSWLPPFAPAKVTGPALATVTCD